MRNFRNLNSWNNGIDLVRDIYELSAGLPEIEQYGIRSQLYRAAVSVPLNIAEGCSRSGDIESKRFLKIAMGSLFEIGTLLVVTQKLNLLDNKKIEIQIEKVRTKQKMVNTLIKRINES